MKNLLAGQPGDHVLFQGLKLGIAAFILNFVVLSTSGNYLLPAGNIALFLAAGSLPLQATIVANAAVILPLALYAPAILPAMIRTFALCAALCFFSRKAPRLPGFLVGILLWMILFWPLSYIDTSGMPLPAFSWPQALVAGLSEIFFLLLSGILLLSPGVWRKLTEHTWHISLSSLLMQVLASIASVSMLGVFSLSGSISGTTLLPYGFGRLEVVWLFCIFALILAAFLGSRLAVVLQNEFSDLNSSAMLRLHNAFSGLSSGYWRRQQEEEARHETEVISSRLEGVSGSAEQVLTKHVLSPELGACTIYRDGTIGFANRKFREFTGITLSNVNGKSVDAVGIEPVLLQHLQDMLRKASSGKNGSIEVKLNNLPDKLRFFELNIVPANVLEDTDPADDADSMLLTIREITERRTIEASLLKAQKVEALGMMVKGFAESFEASLDRIAQKLLLVQTAEQDRQRIAPEKDALTQILEEVNRQLVSVNELLDFATDSPLQLQRCDFGQLVKSKMDFLRRSAGQDCRIKFECQQDVIYLSCDPLLITQVLTNLVLNARESYADKSGPIAVSLASEDIADEMAILNPGSRPGRFARLRVIDQGTGMTGEVLSKAFDPLFTTRRSSGHAGLGLSIVFGIVRAHDGFLTLESHPGKGTSVSIYLPVQQQ